jgi:diguanylate cyclase (GGDEF)-like protein/PAS domain S-box-containing protein
MADGAVTEAGLCDRRALGSAQCAAAIVDASGRIVATNDAWERAARAGGAAAGATGVGADYLRVCDLAAGPFADRAGEAAAGLRAVLGGAVDFFSVEYPCPDGALLRWCSMRVSPIRETGGAVVTHLDITEVKEAEQRLRAETIEPPTAFDDNAPIFALVDESGAILEVSPSTQRLLGLVPDEVVGASAFDRIHPRDLDIAATVFTAALLAPRQEQRVQVRTLDARGHWHDLDLAVVNLLSDERVRGIVVTGSDVTAARMSQIAKRLESRLLQRLPAAVVVVDDRGVIIYWNDRAATLYGYAAEDALGRHSADLDIGPVDRTRAEEVAAGIAADGRWEGDYDARRADGSVAPIYITIETISDPDIGFSGTVGASVDITERRRLQADLAFASLHDPLTGLPNRRLFMDHVASSLARAERGGAFCALLLVDLDRFKDVNDSAGRGIGDSILVAVGRSLGDVVLPGDLMGRFGGDEFLVCCEDIESAGEALQVAQRIQEALRRPFRIDGADVVVTASIGVAVSTPGGHADELLRNAQGAMLLAKQRGRDRAELFDDELHDLARRRHDTAVELAGALDAGQLEVFYQPEIRISTGQLTGFEALVRWRHPERGIIPPDEFIAAAEEGGLIGRLGREVLATSCGMLARWRELSPERSLTVAVNVSARQLQDPEFPGIVREVIADAGVPASRICLEVTESALLDPEMAGRVLRSLKAVGVVIAIDDFGTGYSSLSRLKRFPVDYLKVDRTFVDGIGRDPEDEVIVASVVNLAHSLGLEVIAEGIETADQLERLASLGCEIGQGWLWERAVDAARATELVASPDGWTRASYGEGGPDGADGVDEAIPIDARAAVGLLVHELSGPLTVLAGFAELLAEGDDPARRAYAARAIERNARLARSALAVVSDIAELDNGTLRLTMSDVDLAAVVADAITLAESRKGHDVVFETTVPDLTIAGDADRLAAAITNVLANARKYSPPGSTVRLWTEVTSGDAVALHIADEGPGVPADRVGVIFRKFGRADHGRPGSGLGLYLARGIARAHGGELSYRRAGGGGAEFVLELPLDEGDL